MAKKPETVTAIPTLQEVIGDFAGSPGFQGGPFGFGKQHQLAVYDPDPNLFDPEEEPVDFNRLDTDPHDTPAAVGEGVINDPGRSYYRDLPGFPRMNSLANNRNFVPPDMDKDRDFPEERLKLDLVPDGKDDKRPEYFGYGSLDNEKDWGFTAVDETLNNWKATTRQNMGKIDKSVSYSQLVDPRNYEEELPSLRLPSITDEPNKLEDPDDVLTPSFGGMGRVLAPKMHTPLPEGLDDVGETLLALGPDAWNHTPTGVQADIVDQAGISLEGMIRKAFKEALTEKSPPGMSKKVEAMKAGIAKSNPKWSEEKVANVAFGKAWNSHKAKGRKKG